MRLETFAEGGQFAPGRIAEALRTTRDEVARTVGLGRDAVMRPERVASPRTQKRLREMVEILNRVEPRFGSALIAYASADDWRIRMREDGKAPTQLLAERLIADGHVGMQVRSFARGATRADFNLVLWKWGKTPPAQLIPIDDEGRLG